MQRGFMLMYVVGSATQELRAHPSFFLGHGKTLADLANSETRREILWRNLEDPTYSMFARVFSVLVGWRCVSSLLDAALT